MSRVRTLDDQSLLRYARDFRFVATRRIVVARCTRTRPTAPVRVFLFDIFQQKNFRKNFTAAAATTTTRCVCLRQDYIITCRSHGGVNDRLGLRMADALVVFCAGADERDRDPYYYNRYTRRRGRWRIHPTAVPRDVRDLADSDPPARPPSTSRADDATAAV